MKKFYQEKSVVLNADSQKALEKNHGRMPASLSDALGGDESLPLDSVAKEYWLKDLQNP